MSMNKQGRQILKEIKDMMKASHQFVPDIKAEEKRIRREYADIIKEERKEYPADMEYWYQKRCEQLKQACEQDIHNMMNQYDSENSYYLIYKDGSCVSIMDSDLISGEKMPKLTDIVYAMYSGTCDSWDTETGQLHWYEGCMEENFSYEAEDERKMEYENAIEIKYGTEFGKRINSQKSSQEMKDMTIVEKRKIYQDDLRNLCIRNNWYTRGNCQEYQNVLDMCDKDNITTDDIVEIAQDIMKHSDDEERELTSFCFEIARISYTFFDEINEEMVLEGIPMELEMIRTKDALSKEKARLNRISKDLKIEHQDFKDAENLEMSLDLGENLRDQLKNVFSILEKEGITF